MKLLQNTQSLCSSPVASTVEIEGQNGAALTQQVKAKTACKAKKKAKRHKISKRRHHGRR